MHRRRKFGKICATGENLKSQEIPPMGGLGMIFFLKIPATIGAEGILRKSPPIGRDDPPPVLRNTPITCGA